MSRKDVKPVTDADVSLVKPVTVPSSAVPIVVAPYSPESDGQHEGSTHCARLQNSEILKDLSTKLHHLSTLAQADITHLINSYPTLFTDTPSWFLLMI